MASYLQGNESYSGKTYSQVYQATHDGEGNSLPQLNRSFISFSFGGKPIEDFDIIAVTGGDRLEKSLYASFNDNTTTIDTRNGQLYWGSAVAANELSFTLATDGMDERHLDDFREWFAPGKIRELILAEHPNRAILARVAEAPTYSFLPFEKDTIIKINNNLIPVKTTVYKGEIELKFVMDEPYWYAKLNYMPTYVDKTTLETLSYDDSNPNKVTTIENADMLKIMLEDGIPHQSILIADNQSDFFLGGNILVTERALVGQAKVGDHIGIFTHESEGLNINSSTPQYLFYSGTAKSYPTLKFTMYPSFDFHSAEFIDTNSILDTPWTARYVKEPKNSFVSDEYSYIKIGKKYFYFTTPSLLTSLNKSLYYFKHIIQNTATATVITDLIEQIPDYYARAWAIACVKSLNTDKINVNGGHTIALCNNMMALITNNNFKDLDNEIIIPNSNINAHFDITDQNSGGSILLNKLATFSPVSHANPITFIFDSATGEAIMQTSIRVAPENNIDNSEIINIEQNVGDMVCSDYPIIEDRNYLNSNGQIDLANCTLITSDLDLSNVLIFYKNMYL